MAINIWIGTTDNWTATANWSLAAVPVSTNDVYLTASNQSIASNLSQSAVTLNSLSIDLSYTGLLGNFGSSEYLNIGSNTTNIGASPASGSGNGSKRLNIQLANSAAAVNILGGPQSGVDSGQFPIRILGANLTLSMTGGAASVAAKSGETANILNLTISKGTGGTAPTLFLGSGCTVANITQAAGNLTISSAAAIGNATLSGTARARHAGTGGATTLSINSGARLSYDGSGNITNLNIPGGTLDLSNGTAPVVSANTVLYKGATIFDPAGRLTNTNVTLVGCTLADLKLNLGIGRKL